jgi:tetratricopeptide (TPR) repeat protein
MKRHFQQMIRSGCRHAAMVLLLAPVPARAGEVAGPSLQVAGEKLAIHDFGNAEKDFRSALEAWPEEAPGRERALYGLALCLWHRTPGTPALNREARELLARVARDFPGSEVAPLAQRSLARLLEVHDFPGDVMDLAAARAAYQDVIRRWPDHPAAAQAGLHLAGAYLREVTDPAAVAEGLRLLRAWIEAHPGHDLAPVAWEYLGSASDLVAHDSAAALEAYRAADALGFVVPSRASVTRWRMAQLAEECGRNEVAVDCYRKVIQLTPRGGRAHDAQKALRRLARQNPGLAVDIPTIPGLDGGAP